MKNYLILLLLSGISLTACKHDAVVPTSTPGQPATGNGNGGGGGGGNNNHPCHPDTVYFENDILPLIISNCAMSGCHDAQSAQDEVILTNYSNIIQSGQIIAGNPGDSELFEKITESRLDKRMPPPPTSALSTAQIALVRKWIQQGAKNNRCDNNAGPCDTSNLSYAIHIVPLFQGNCTGCHNNNLSSGGVNLATHAQTVVAATSGRLLGALKHSSGFVAMPLGGSRLDSCSIAKVELWIQKGLPNN
jgi:mono/diheme cytochrome c family protein